MRIFLRRAAWHALVLIALLFPFAAASARESMSGNVMQRLRAATVMVYIEYAAPYQDYLSWGTGFVVGDGLVMTNAHVVKERVPTRIYITNEYLPPTEARVLAFRYDTNGLIGLSGVDNAAEPLAATASGGDSFLLSPAESNYDVAVLAFDQPPGLRLPSLSFSRNATASQGVFAVGYPVAEGRGGPYHSGPATAQASPPTFTQGRVNQVIGGQPVLVMHDAFCKTGNSGGPIVNAQGEVLGMQTWSALPDHRTRINSFAIASRDLIAFLHGVGYQPLVGGAAPAPRPLW